MRPAARAVAVQAEMLASQNQAAELLSAFIAGNVPDHAIQHCSHEIFMTLFRRLLKRMPPFY